jgi:hypothetical protein
VPSSHRYRSLVRPSFLLAWLLLVWVPALADADELVAAHLAALHDSLDLRAAAALDRIGSLGPKLLAARSYLRSAAHLAERWSWTQAEIDAYEGSPAQAALDAEISRVREAFEAANAGYTLFVNPRVRSLDVQLQHWNENRSVADAGENLLEALRGIVGAGGFPAPGTQDARTRFSQALKAHQPQPTPALAAPGLSPHGQMHAVDFQVRQGGITIAGPSTEQVQAVWLGQGWRNRLESAIRQASDKFRGPLQNPDEPWHYDYRP